MKSYNVSKPVPPPMKATRLEKLLVLLLLVVAVDLGRRVVLHYTERPVERVGPTQVIVVQPPAADTRAVAAVPVWSNPPLSSVRPPPEPLTPPSPNLRAMSSQPGNPGSRAGDSGEAGGLGSSSEMKRFDLGSRTIAVEYFAPGAITMIAVPDEGADSGDGGDGSPPPP